MMVVPYYPYPVAGGLEKQAHELAKALIAQGVQVKAISGKFDDSQSTYETIEGVEVYRIPLSKIKCLRFLQSSFYLFWILFSYRKTFDIVHLHQYSWFALFTILTAKLFGKATITKLPNVSHSEIKGNGIIGVSRGLLGPLKLKILLSSDAIVAMTKQSLLELRSVNFPSGRIFATPNGIQLPKLNRINQQVSDVCKVVFVGRLLGQKGLEDLLYAWAAVIKNNSAQLEIWGDGPIKPELESLALDLGIHETVIFPGRINNVIEQLPRMNIFVLPSYSEGNSNAILEAMAAGLPIISTNVGGTPMQVGEDGLNFLIEPGDKCGLAIKLETLIRDAALRITLGMQMRSRIENRFDIKYIAQTYISAYSYLANNQRDQVFNASNPVVVD